MIPLTELHGLAVALVVRRRLGGRSIRAASEVRTVASRTTFQVAALSRSLPI